MSIHALHACRACNIEKDRPQLTQKTWISLPSNCFLIVAKWQASANMVPSLAMAEGWWTSVTGKIHIMLWIMGSKLDGPSRRVDKAEIRTWWWLGISFWARELVPISLPLFSAESSFLKRLPVFGMEILCSRREKDEIVSKRKYIKQNMKQKTPRSSEETKYHR